MNDNPIHSSDLHKLCNNYVTNVCNSNGIFPIRSQFKFIKRALEMNVIAKKQFCYLDFEMSNGYFRQMIYRLNRIIIKEINSRPASYRLKGIIIPGNITKKYTGARTSAVSVDFEKLLLDLKHQPPLMHDLRIQTYTNLHEKLCGRGILPHKQNNAFTIPIQISKRFETKVNVYSGKMMFMIGCSQNPIPYSITGFQDLIFYLGQACHYLTQMVSSSFVVQDISEWIVTYYHFNKDGKTIQSPIFNYTVEDLENHSLVYMKHFDDGKTRLRYEEHRTPKKPLSELEMEAKNEAFYS